MTTILAIDSASGGRLSIGLRRGGRNIVIGHDTEFNHSRSLLSAVDEVMEGRREPLDAIIVTRGPGSYAGLRAGIATAYGLGLAANAPVLGCGTLDAVARAAGNTEFAAIHPAGRGEFAVQEFRDGQPAGAPRIAAPEELAALELAGEGAGKLGGREFGADERCRALLDVAEELLAADAVSGVEPFYLREPQITAPRRSRMSGALRA